MPEPNAVELVKTIKKAAVQAVAASKPAAVLFGKVTSVSPLQINVEQKLTLGAAQLVLSRSVTEHEIDITVDHYTENGLDTHTHGFTGGSGTIGETNLSHRHKYAGKKTFTVHNGLVVGDEVILIRQQGGQKYVVADKIG